MTPGFIGLGANLGKPPAQLRSALSALAVQPDIRLLAVSPFYRSAAIGPGRQPDYCNAVAAVLTALAPDRVLARLLEIERALGRVRGGQRWLPRTLDLDLLSLGPLTCAEPALQLPHPRLAERPFVLLPWCDIAPWASVPGRGQVAALAAACHPGDVRRW